MICCGLKNEEICYVLVNKFHEIFHSKTSSCWKIESVFRDVKWCFNASWELKGLMWQSGWLALLSKPHPSNTRHWPNAGWTLTHPPRRLPKLQPALGELLVAGDRGLGIITSTCIFVSSYLPAPVLCDVARIIISDFVCPYFSSFIWSWNLRHDEEIFCIYEK